MRTMARLDKAFYGAFPVPFDDHSKLVFFSDVHRGDDSISDEFGRNKHIYYYALNHYYRNDYTYIEVGDGDELIEQRKFKHIRNAHPAIFKVLKQFYDDNRLYMLYGNHNIQLKDEQWVKDNYYSFIDEFSGIEEDLFPGIYVHEALILKHRDTGQEIFVVHGHQGDLMNDQLHIIPKIMISIFWKYLHIAGFQYAASPSKSRQKRHKVEKNFSKWTDKHGITIICGHTHRPVYPKQGESNYFNTGCCIHPRGIQCIEITYGKIRLVNWIVSSRKDGTMYIKRKVLKGPSSLVTFAEDAISAPHSKEFLHTNHNGNKLRRLQKREFKAEEKGHET
ncbi:MAG: serine/threonine protein phosphatase [Clostridiales Family XIII bacterium]|jgi:UDP-2,3-diacylglucosamine pyrophosphatase LpxH|nr:serine/threonine protein phosphatase [Clostridiales Family XIII bacterium]